MNARLWRDGEPIAMTCDKTGRPQHFRRGSHTHQVEHVCNRWRVHEGWWRDKENGWREYIKIATSDGLLCLVVRDMENDVWFLVRLYD